MVILTRRQTRAFQKLMKKYEFETFGIGPGKEPGQIVIHAVDWAGWTGYIVMEEDGRATAALRAEDEELLRRAGILE